MSQTGNLLLIRQYLNLSTTSTNLLDAPEIFWEDHGPALELWFKEITRALEVKTRLDNLNRKLDYCLQVQETLQNLESTVSLRNNFLNEACTAELSMFTESIA